MGSGWMFSPVDIMIHSGGEMESGEREEGRRKGECRVVSVEGGGLARNLQVSMI